MSAVRVWVLADAEDDDAGFVGERLVDRHGAELLLLDREQLPASAPPDDAAASLLLLLGSSSSVLDPARAATVESESSLVRRALAGGVPVIGICYGAQLLAHALGGRVTVAPVAEIGWFPVTSRDAELCPPGPWAQFHSDAFVPPPGSRVLGTSVAGCQGFAHEPPSGARAIGWQFHPEVTAARFSEWVDRLAGYCRAHGADPDLLMASAATHEPRLRVAAHELVDATLAWLHGVPARRALEEVR